MEAEDRDVPTNSPRRSEQDNFEYSNNDYDYDPDTEDNVFDDTPDRRPDNFMEDTVQSTSTRRGRVPQDHNTHGPQYDRGGNYWRPKLYNYEDWEHRHRKKDKEPKREVVRAYTRRSGVN